MDTLICQVAKKCCKPSPRQIFIFSSPAQGHLNQWWPYDQQIEHSCTPFDGGPQGAGRRVIQGRAWCSSQACRSVLNASGRLSSSAWRPSLSSRPNTYCAAVSRAYMSSAASASVTCANPSKRLLHRRHGSQSLSGGWHSNAFHSAEAGLC